MAELKGAGIAARVWEIAKPIAEAQGVSLWDVRFVKEGAFRFLRIILDKPGGVSIDDCEAVSRAVDPVLDELDFISESYYLEVSSPGLGRDLTRESHFEAMNGRAVLVRLIRPKDGQRELTGVLSGFSGGVIKLVTPDGETEIKKNETAFVRIADDEDEDMGGFME